MWCGRAPPAIFCICQERVTSVESPRLPASCGSDRSPMAVVCPPRSAAIAIPKSDAPPAEPGPQRANPQSHDRDIIMSPDTTNARISFGSIGSSLSSNAGWDLPLSEEPNRPLLDESDFAQLSEDFAVGETGDVEKMSLENNMNLIDGLHGSEEDEMQSIWSDCYFSFGQDTRKPGVVKIPGSRERCPRLRLAAASA